MDKKAFFNEMAPTWDQRFYPPAMQERLRPLAADFHLRPGARVLDLGAGTGGIIPFLLQAVGKAGSIEAVDFAEEMVRIGSEKFRDDPRVRFHLAAAEALDFPDSSFDHVVCFGLFPHLEDKAEALREMARVLRRNGTLIIAHALSSAELRERHQGNPPVSTDFLPAEEAMKGLLTAAGLRLLRLIDRPRYYLCEGKKES